MSKARRVAIPLVLAAAAAARIAAQPFDPSSFSGMRWRMAGPFRGGRVLAVALACPGNRITSTSARSAAACGRRDNAGRTWEPIFDGQPSLRSAPSRSRRRIRSVIYVGTGEADMRSDISYGNGMYKLHRRR